MNIIFKKNSTKKANMKYYNVTVIFLSAAASAYAFLANFTSDPVVNNLGGGI